MEFEGILILVGMIIFLSLIFYIILMHQINSSKKVLGKGEEKAII